MKLLCLADKIDPGLWDYYRREKTAGIDMILACGDLPPKYLEFLVTMANCPLLYVRGNHDELVHMSPPEGCECVEDKLVTVNGLKKTERQVALLEQAIAAKQEREAPPR